MKKGTMIIFMVLLLLITFVWADNSNQAIKRVQWSRDLSKLTQSELSQTKTDVVQIRTDSKEMMRNKMGKIHHSQNAQMIQKKHQFLSLKDGFQPVQVSTDKFKPMSSNYVISIDTMALVPFVPDTVHYIAGDSFIFQIFSNDTVALEFWVDNGDGVFGSDDFMIKMEGDDGEAVKVWDGAEFDESAPGDGLFQVTLNTSNLSNDGPEPYFGLQNCIVYVNAWNIMFTEIFQGVAIIGAPDEETSVEGTVTYDDGLIKSIVPAENIIVYAVKIPADTTGDWDPEVGFVAMTDASGYYRIEIPDMYRGDYFVGIGDMWDLLPGYFPVNGEVRVGIYGDVSPVDFNYIQGKETIYGVVEDESANGIGGIHVRAWGPYGESEVMTGPDGTYSIPAMPGWWEIAIDEDDIYGQYMLSWCQYIEVFENGDHPVNFTLYTLNATFSGHISTTSGTPLADVNVNTDIWFGQDAGFFNYTYTDEFGDYVLGVSTVLQGIPFDDGWGWIDTSSYWIGAWMENTILMPDSYYDQYAPASGLDFTAIVADASLSGIVYDASNNSPLWDAQIHAYVPYSEQTVKSGLLYTPDFWAYTNELGFYELPLIGSGYPGTSWVIEVYWPWNWMPSVVDSFSVVSGNNYTKDYYINPPITEGKIEGYVFNENGYGISNARVEIYSWDNYYELYTDGNGYFNLQNVPFGWYSATAYAEGYDPYNINDFYVEQNPVYIEFWMGSIVGDILVNGIVVDETAAPIKGALLMLYNWNYYESMTLMTNDSGFFSINVKPGWYDFQVGANGFGAFGESLDISHDTTIVYGLNSIVIPDTLQGNVVDDAGNPLRKVFIYMEKYNYETYTVDYMGYVYTDINGHYKIALPAGSINGMYSKDGFNTEWRYFDFPNSMPEDPITLWSTVHVFGPQIIDVMDVPEDHGKQVRLSWKRADGLWGSVKEYQIWRAIEPFNGQDPNPEVNYNWDYITTVPVHPEMDSYNVVVPTLYDAVGDDIHWTGFMIAAIGWDGWSYWNSNMLAGFSIDNLPPEVPTSLNALVGEAITLQWEPVTSEKVKYYSVYRKSGDADFAIIGYSATSEFIDESASLSQTNTYVVTATDFGLNESDRSEPVTIEALAIGDEEKIPTEYALKPNYPNPFNPETTIEFALPKTSKVTMTIYNLTGQMVQQLVQNEYSAGYHRIVWNGRDFRGNAVGSGVYIYTLKAGDFSQTRKMVLVR